VDFIDILLYTERQWGEDQQNRYEALLTQAINRLGDFPETGAARSELFPGCRVWHVERHVLYYKIGIDTIEVVRILHQRIDPRRAFRSMT
jgi:toxin ParE1/3/4